MMLLAVEGGGFFSSSASGYSKGLTLLLLGQKNEDKPMRVAPWTQYQLVDQEIVQLAPGKNRLIRRCASFVCFGRPAVSRPDGPSPPKVEPTQNREFHQGPEEPDGIKDAARSFDSTVKGDGDGDDDSNRKIGISRKSSLKKSVDIEGANVDGGGCGNSNKHDLSCERDSEVTCQTERRKVQWTDATGGELFEIREFEMSDNGSDDEFDHGDGKTCACRIM